MKHAWWVGAVLVVWTGCTRSHPPTPDGKSNWLTVCERSDDCEDGSACLCGVCTTACDADAPCERTGGPRALCAESTELHHVCAEPGLVGHAGICLPVCNRDGDCDPRLSCIDGLCLSDEIVPAAETPGNVCIHADDCGLQELGSVDLVTSDTSTATPVLVASPESAGDPTRDTSVLPDDPSPVDAGQPGSAGSPSAAPDSGEEVGPTSCATGSEQSELLDVVDDFYHPKIAVDRLGRVLAMWVEHDWNPAIGARETHLTFSRYEDVAGWSPPQRLASATDTSGQSVVGATFAINDDGVGFAAWMETEGQRILASRYDGTTFDAAPTVLSAGSLDYDFLYLEAGIDAAGDAWVTWGSSADGIVGRRYAASSGVWSAPVSLAGSVSPGAAPARPAHRLFVSPTGDAVIFWRSAGTFSARYYREGAWAPADSVVQESEVFAFGFGEDGLGVGWFTELLGDGTRVGRIRRFGFEGGWDDGFLVPDHGDYAYAQLIAIDDTGTVFGMSGTSSGAWSAFELLPGATAIEHAGTLFTDQSNQWDALTANGNGHVLAAWGLEGGSSIRYLRHCADLGWGTLTTTGGGNNGVYAAAINAHGRAAMLLGGSNHEVLGVILD